MKKILLDKNENRREYYIRLEKNEVLNDALSKFVKEENIGFATFDGLGANKDTDYGAFLDGEFFHLMEKEQCELNSINGNIAWKDGEPAIHAHCAFSKRVGEEMINFSGHIFSMTTAVTIELSLIAYEKRIERKYSEECKLNLLDLDKTM